MMISRNILTKTFGMAMLALSVCALSCTRPARGEGGNPIGGEVPMQIGITRGGGAMPFESATKRVRIVIFGAYNSSDRGKLLLNRYFPVVTENEVLKFIVTSGLRDIYLVVNEPLDSSNLPLTAFTNIAVKSDIGAIQLAYSGEANSTVGFDPWLPSDFVMFESYPDYEIRHDGSSLIGQGIGRTAVKATLNINYKLSELTGDEVVFDRICVKSLPRWSWLAARAFLLHGGYTGTFIDSEMQKITPVRSGSGVNEKITTTNTFYLPEHILNDEANFSYFEIYAHLKTDPTATFKYTTKIGDGINPPVSGSTRFDLRRNTHYVFAGKVINYGDLQLGLEIEATILPWNKYSFITTEGEELKLEKTYRRFTHNDGVLNYTLRNIAPGQEIRIMVEDPDLFEVTHLADGVMYKRYTIQPKQYTPGRNISTKIYALTSNGTVIGQTLTQAEGEWKFTWAVKTIDLNGGRTLRIMDRNIGSVNPKCDGNVFLRNTVSGLGVYAPGVLNPISKETPGVLWSINSWDPVAYAISRPDSYEAVMNNIVAGSTCPPGWRLPTEEEIGLIIPQMTPYGTFASESESGYSIPAMEGGDIYLPAAGFYTIRTGVSAPIEISQVGVSGIYLVQQPDPNPANSDKVLCVKETSHLVSEISTLHSWNDNRSFCSVRCVQDGL